MLLSPCSDPDLTFVGFSWDSSDEGKMQQTFGKGRADLFARFFDLLQAIAARAAPARLGRCWGSPPLGRRHAAALFCCAATFALGPHNSEAEGCAYWARNAVLELAAANRRLVVLAER
jgi:hypothetical protein